MSTQIVRYSEKGLSTNNQQPFIIRDETLDSSQISIPLIGLYYEDYPKPLQEAILWSLENFAGDTPPANAVQGQIWYNKTEKIIYVYDGEDTRNGGDSTLINDWVKPFEISLNDFSSHLLDFNNPHNVTKAQIGLSNVINATQLVAANNLSDLTDVVSARNNLNVYDKAYIDANFIVSGGGVADATSLSGISSTQFLRSDINDTADGDITFIKSALFSTTSGKPITLDNGKSFIEVYNNDIFVKAGSYYTTIGTADKYATTNNGAAKISFETGSKNGTIKLSVANTGTSGVDITYTDLSVSATGITWKGTEKVLTDAGFILNGPITPISNNSLDLGTATLKFNEVFATNFKGTADNSVLLNDLTNDVNETANTIVQRDSTGNIKANTLYSTAPLVSEPYDLSVLKMAVRGVDNAIKFVDPVKFVGVPPGAIMDFAMNSAPSGWLKCNGDAISRTTYSALFAAIGTTWGAGNGTTTFNLPDARGEFRRGWDDGRGVDSGRTFGTQQVDEIKTHDHPIDNTDGSGSHLGFVMGTGRPTNPVYKSGATGGAETRPRNIAVLACIKY